MEKALFVIPPKTQLLDIMGPIHLFYEARELGATVALHFLSMDGGSEQGTCAGLFLHRLENFEEFDCGPDDWIIVPGMEMSMVNYELFGQYRLFLKWLKCQHKQNTKICSICTGAFILGYAGILDNIKCTVHWKYVHLLKERFPRSTVIENRFFIQEVNVYTSAGVTSGLDLTLFLLEEKYGPNLTANVSREVVLYYRRSKADPQLSMALRYRNHIEGRIHTVQNIINQQLDEQLTIEILADRVHMTPRNLIRVFKKTTGLTIGEYQKRVRIERLALLRKHGVDYRTIAAECGLSLSQLRRLNDQL